MTLLWPPSGRITSDSERAVTLEVPAGIRAVLRPLRFRRDYPPMPTPLSTRSNSGGRSDLKSTDKGEPVAPKIVAPIYATGSASTLKHRTNTDCKGAQKDSSQAEGSPYAKAFSGESSENLTSNRRPSTTASTCCRHSAATGMGESASTFAGVGQSRQPMVVGRASSDRACHRTSGCRSPQRARRARSRRRQMQIVRGERGGSAAPAPGRGSPGSRGGREFLVAPAVPASRPSFRGGRVPLRTSSWVQLCRS
jgi:hypothetical protein